MEVSIPLAFLAGLASFLSPCVFSLVPAYIGYLSGRAVAMQQNQQAGRKIETLTHGLAFVLGFSLVFITLGIAASALGAILYDVRNWLAKIGGVVVILFGLHMTGIFRIKFLEYDLRPRSSDDLSRSYVSSALLGVFFSAGWSPCVGPVLGTILTLAARGGNVAQGIQLLTAYSAGLAIPFLAAALGVGWVSTILRKYQKALHIIEICMGVLLIIVGLLLFLGVFETLARYGWFVDFGI
jgi:cytochrome c-type biogenesis protein